jgi:hypothetical protein
MENLHSRHGTGFNKNEDKKMDRVCTAKRYIEGNCEGDKPINSCRVKKKKNIVVNNVITTRERSPIFNIGPDETTHSHETHTHADDVYDLVANFQQDAAQGQGSRNGHTV